MNENLINLGNKKDGIELEIENINKELIYYQQKGYDQNLVDAEGFPKAELDFGELSKYRNLKRRMNELLNDHKALMLEIEQGLIKFHEEKRQSGEAEKELQQHLKMLEAKKQQQQQQQKELAEQQQKQEALQEQEEEKEIPMEVQEEKVQKQTLTKEPFAIITEVTADSPSFQSNILVYDLIVAFGWVDASNNENLSKLPEVVRENVNKEIPVQILRPIDQADEVLQKEGVVVKFKESTYFQVDVKLTPKQWKGQGLLGCRFKQL